MCSLGFPGALDDVLEVVHWLSQFLGKPQLLVPWKVSVASVVDIFSNSKDQWVIELIENVAIHIFNVLNTITISIGDGFTVPSLATIAALDERQVLWTVNVCDVEREAFVLLHLNVFEVAHAIGHLSFNIFLTQVLSGQLGLRESLWWLWQIFLFLLGDNCLL